jgi:hypothetical protein
MMMSSEMMHTHGMCGMCQRVKNLWMIETPDRT